MKTFLITLVSLITLLTANAQNKEVGLACCGQSCCATVMTSTNRYSDNSLYQLQGQWINDDGRSATLAAQKGRIQVVTMFFAHCSYACPLLVYKMKQIENALPANVRPQVAFTLVSFDSERDTPAALHEYRENHQLGTNWTLLHGTVDDVLDLAAVLGVKFSKGSSGQFQHSNLISVLNQSGEIANQETGLDLNTAAIVREIEALAKQKGNEHAAH